MFSVFHLEVKATEICEYILSFHGAKYCQGQEKKIRDFSKVSVVKIFLNRAIENNVRPTCSREPGLKYVTDFCTFVQFDLN